MNKTAMLAWIEALESGQYTQIDYPMHTKDGFCKLGVLVDVYRKQFGGEWVEGKCWCASFADSFEQRFEFLDCAYLWPDEVRKWINLDCRCPDGKSKTHEVHLSACEALRVFTAFEQKGTFHEIAQRLRALTPD